MLSIMSLLTSVPSRGTRLSMHCVWPTDSPGSRAPGGVSAGEGISRSFGKPSERRFRACVMSLITAPQAPINSNDDEYTALIRVACRRKGVIVRRQVLILLYCFPLQLRGEIINIPADQPTIQAGIDSANARDEVVVAPGIYVETLNYNGKTITVRSTNPTDPSIVVSTVINGGGRGAVVTFNSGETADALLAGITIIGGIAQHGGGVHVSFSSPTISGCTFSGNFASSSGGGIYSESGSPTISNCRISNNSTNSFGGGAEITGGSPTFSNCTFSGNTAGTGGGIFIGDNNGFVDNCTFVGNTAGLMGGGIYIGLGSPTVNNCTFTGNSAATGGGIYSYNSSPDVSNCTFTGIADFRGGGMYNHNSNTKVTNCLFFNNTTGEFGDGGGMYNFFSSPIVSSCTFSGNLSGDGGGIANEGGSPTVSSCTISDNSAYDDGGGMCNNNSNTVVHDSSICGNTPTQVTGLYSDAGGNIIGLYCPPPPPKEAPCPGDVDESGTVGAEDLAFLLGAWGVCP